MTIKNIMVHLDGTPRTTARLDMAVALARRFNARLTGIFGQLAKPEQVGTVVTWPPRGYAEAGAASKAQFEKAAAGLTDTEWRDINRGGNHEVIAQVTHHARFADLVVMGQYDSRHEGSVPAQLVNEVVLHCGRPVLILPYIGEFAEFGKRPLIALTETGSAVRAVHDALPLIAGAPEALLFSIAPKFEDAQTLCQEMAVNLKHHGITTRVEAFSMKDNEGLGVMDMVLNRITDKTSDMLVMGASDLQGRKGDNPRHLLEHMIVPTLVAG